MLRLVLVAFLGRPRTPAAEHVHESPGVMTVPLLVLAIPSLFAGFWGIDAFYARQFGISEAAASAGWAAQIFAPFVHAPAAAFASLAAVALGALQAWTLYAGAQRDPLPAKLGALAQAMRHRFYFDELYARIVASTQDTLAAAANAIDQWILDGVLVRGAHGTTELVGRLLRLVQTGNLQTYALLFAIGVVVLLYFAVGR